VIDNANWAAVDAILVRGMSPQTLSQNEFERLRHHTANALGRLPIIGDPDTVAHELNQLVAAGLTGIAVSFVNYTKELP
jgi:dimethylsulfone monooxygenase